MGFCFFPFHYMICQCFPLKTVFSDTFLLLSFISCLMGLRYSSLMLPPFLFSLLTIHTCFLYFFSLIDLFLVWFIRVQPLKKMACMHTYIHTYSRYFVPPCSCLFVSVAALGSLISYNTYIWPFLFLCFLGSLNTGFFCVLPKSQADCLVC